MFLDEMGLDNTVELSFANFNLNELTSAKIGCF